MNLLSAIDTGAVKLELETISNKLKNTKDYGEREIILNDFKNKFKGDVMFKHNLNKLLVLGDIDLHIRLFLEEGEVVFLKMTKLNMNPKGISITGKVSLTNTEKYKEEQLMIVGLENITDVVVF